MNIRAALAKMNYYGPVTIFTDTTRIPISAQPDLYNISHIRYTMIHDMLHRTNDNPAPANYLLISGDEGYSRALHYFLNQNHNILLAHPDGAFTDLVVAASLVWHWASLANGDLPYSFDYSKLVLKDFPLEREFRS